MNDRPSNGSVEAPAAGFMQRALALLLDMGICFLIVWGSAFITGAVTSGGDSRIASVVNRYWLVLPAAGSLIYFTLLYHRGATLGMRVAGVRLVEATTGGQPGILRSLARAGFALAAAVSLIGAVNYGFSDAPARGYSAAEQMVLDLLLVVLAISVLGRLWMLVDRHGRTLFDRLLGIAVLRNIPAPMGPGAASDTQPGPSRDISHG